MQVKVPTLAAKDAAKWGTRPVTAYFTRKTVLLVSMPLLRIAWTSPVVAPSGTVAVMSVRSDTKFSGYAVEGNTR